MAKKIGIFVAAAILILVVLVATRPDSFRVERSAPIEAPPEVAFDLINDFHQWGAWSPWEKMDPNMKRTYEGEPAGVGALYSWVGNDQVGEGRMTIVESQRPEKVLIQLEFLKPFAATNQTTFLIAPRGAASQVTWRMEGKNDFMGKAFSVLMDMDAMVGKDFERGLQNLNAAAQEAVKARGTAAPPVGEAPSAGEAPGGAEAQKPE